MNLKREVGSAWFGNGVAMTFFSEVRLGTSVCESSLQKETKHPLDVSKIQVVHPLLSPKRFVSVGTNRFSFSRYNLKCDQVLILTTKYTEMLVPLIIFIVSAVGSFLRQIPCGYLYDSIKGSRPLEMMFKKEKKREKVTPQMWLPKVVICGQAGHFLLNHIQVIFEITEKCNHL